MANIKNEKYSWNLEEQRIGGLGDFTIYIMNATNLGVQLFEYDREKLLTTIDNHRILCQIYFETINISCFMWTTTLTSYFSPLSRNYKMKHNHILKDILNKIYYIFYNINETYGKVFYPLLNLQYEQTLDFPYNS